MLRRKYRCVGAGSGAWCAYGNHRRQPVQDEFAHDLARLHQIAQAVARKVGGEGKDKDRDAQAVAENTGSQSITAGVNVEDIKTVAKGCMNP